MSLLPTQPWVKKQNKLKSLALDVNQFKENSECPTVEKATGNQSTNFPRKSWQFTNDEGTLYVVSHDQLHPEWTWFRSLHLVTSEFHTKSSTRENHFHFMLWGCFIPVNTHQFYLPFYRWINVYDFSALPEPGIEFKIFRESDITNSLVH